LVWLVLYIYSFASTGQRLLKIVVPPSIEIYSVLHQVIALALIHPHQPIPVNHWAFAQSADCIRVGRSNDNDVVLYSAVVSRYHLKLTLEDTTWWVTSLGANGTYVNNERITRLPLEDGMMLRLARSGPQLQISLSHHDLPYEAPREVPREAPLEVSREAPHFVTFMS